jgi:signal transduction histidine kinase
VSGPPCAILIRGDRVRLAQAIGNLVANALEHGAGAVALSARPSAGRVRIEVADEGPGLPAPVDALLARAGGAGARRGHGLAVAADVAARHGGRLVASAGEGGARVALELPAVFAVAAPGGIEATTA